MQHWKEHKSTCTTIKKCYDNWKEGESSKTLPDGSALDTKEGPCAICLEETITNPVVLPCGHVFCFDCVGQYQWASENAASCPYCRGEIPNVVTKHFDRADLYKSRAFSSSHGSEEQKKYAKLALAEYDAIFKIESHPPLKVQMCILHGRSHLMSLTDQPEETIKITTELISLIERNPGIFGFSEIASTTRWLAEAYGACGKWKESLALSMSVYLGFLQRGVHPKATFTIGLSRAMYETGDYDKAIKLGNETIEANRICSGVHKYVALSQKAQGDIEEAKKTISRAILYEEHWNKDNLRQNKDILKELSNL